MKKFLEALAWGFTILIGLTIVFVKSPTASGQSGGTQASAILDAAGGSLAKVINSTEGG